MIFAACCRGRAGPAKLRRIHRRKIPVFPPQTGGRGPGHENNTQHRTLKTPGNIFSDYQNILFLFSPENLCGCFSAES